MPTRNVMEFEDDETVPSRQMAELVESVTVRGLFGRYNYDLDFPQGTGSDRLVLFYAENGSGKTTVLRILRHLLSASGRRGHRTAIAEVTFELFKVILSNGTVISASRGAAVSGPYNIDARQRGRRKLATSKWGLDSVNTFREWSTEMLSEGAQSIPESLRHQAQEELARRRFIEFLEKLGAQPYLLADDRNIHSDSLDPTPNDRRLRELRHRSALDPLGADLQAHAANVTSEQLKLTIERVNEFLSRKSFGGTRSGSANANSVYLDVLKQLATATSATPADGEDLLSLHMRIENHARRSQSFEKLRLVPRFPADEYLRALNTADLNRAQNMRVANAVLTPYLSTLDARLDALSDTERLISTFLDEANGFLRDKMMTYTPSRGLQIRTDDGHLSHTQLSSGERQLALLLCNALLSRSNSRLFLIDEPELSLNVKWQRGIVRSLLSITEGTSVQFVIATHSIELISGYRDNVVTFRRG